jgi:hypothetical protein
MSSRQSTTVSAMDSIHLSKKVEVTKGDIKKEQKCTDGIEKTTIV